LRIRIFLLLIVILASSFLVGCTSSAKPDSIAVVEDDHQGYPSFLTSTSTASPPFTPTADLSIKEESTSTPEPEPTEEPTPTPTVTSTPEPLFSELGQVPINASTLNQLDLLDTLGYGRINQLDYHQDAGVFIVKTALGVYLYEGEYLNRIAFYELVKDIYQVPGKTQMVAVTPERTLVLIDLKTGQIVQTMEPEKVNRFNGFAFSQDGEMMAVVVVQDHEVRLNWEQSRIDVWDLRQNKKVAKLISDILSCYSMAFSDDHAWLMSGCSPSGGGAPQLVKWNISTQEITWAIKSTGGFSTYPISKDGSLFATYVINDPTTGSSRITIHQSLTGLEIGRVYGKFSQNPFSHDSQHIITTSFDQITVWHTADSQRVSVLDTGLVWPSASYSEDGRYILVNDGQQAWDAKDFFMVEDYVNDDLITPEVTMSQWRQQGHLSDIRGVEVLEDQQVLVWGFSENEYVWWWYPDNNSYDEVSVGTGKGQPVLSPGKNEFAICTDEGVKIISMEQKTFKTFGHCKMEDNFLTFSKDGDVLYKSSGILIDVISVKNGEILQQLRVHESSVGNLQISESGDYLVTSDIGIIRGACETILWELNPLKFVRKWIIPVQAWPSQCLVRAKINHDRTNLVTVHDKVSIWRISDGWYLKYFDGTAVAYSKDESILAVGTRDSQILFYETNRWELLETISKDLGKRPLDQAEFFYVFQGANSGIRELQFANQGQLLIAILYDDFIQLWGVP
jgi:hypothetical protein